MDREHSEDRSREHMEMGIPRAREVPWGGTSREGLDGAASFPFFSSIPRQFISEYNTPKASRVSLLLPVLVSPSR